LNVEQVLAAILKLAGLSLWTTCRPQNSQCARGYRAHWDHSYFVLPCWPDRNAIESLFAKSKAMLRAGRSAR
jgi:hypothetical protein